MWSYNPHQVEGAEWVLETLGELGIAYLAWQERTRKTGTALLAVENSSLETCLVITKKKPIDDWLKSIDNFGTKKKYTVINYESLHKVKGTYDIVILDESHHALAKYPKPSVTWKLVAKFTKGKPIIFISATPYPESLSQIYHQFKLSDWSPFYNYDTFYKWHEEYGEPYLEFIGARQVKKYDRTKEKIIMKIIHPYFSHMTRADVGFKHEPKDKIHRITLSHSTQAKYDRLSKSSVLELGDETIVAETAGSLLQKLAQLIGGTMKVEDIENSTEDRIAYKTFWTGNTEKIDYIKDTWGDHDKMVIMYHYKEEEHLLKHHFKQARILQADTWAEGISLKDYDPLIIYSMSWRTSKHIQRRARQADQDREEEIIVHYLLTQRLVDNYIYEAVGVKHVNFNARYYFDGE